ncbi:MAG: hypothetical protein RL172_485 [Bacteroidota bacterium]|jgi:hypothetical protein
MSIKKINPRFSVLLLLITAFAAMRIPNAAQLTPWSNFSPVGAMGLFGGAYFSNRYKAFVFPLLTLLLSDLVINLLVFKGQYGAMYNGWYIIYGIFILIVLLGKWLIKNVTIKSVVLAAVSAALLHWLLADFSVWISGGTDLRTMTPLAKNWDGLMQCYAQGFPYMKNFLLGNLLYATVMFGCFEMLQYKYPVLKIQYA